MRTQMIHQMIQQKIENPIKERFNDTSKHTLHDTLKDTSKDTLHDASKHWLPWHGTAYAVPLQYPIFVFAPSNEKTVIG